MLKPLTKNKAPSKLDKFSTAFFLGIDCHYADGNSLENIIVVVKTTPGQITTGQLGNLRYFTKWTYTCSVL